MAAHRGTLPSATPPVVTPCTTLPQLAWLLAPLASPSIAHYTGSCSRVSCTVAVWGHAGMEQEEWPRLPCPELPRCSQAVESSGQQQPAHSSGQRGHDQGQESVGGEGAPPGGGQRGPAACPGPGSSCSCWGRGWRWWRGRAAARGLPLHWSWLLGAAAAEEME